MAVVEEKDWRFGLLLIYFFSLPWTGGGGGGGGGGCGCGCG